MKTTIIHALGLISSGLIMVCIGLIYKIPSFSQWDNRVTTALHKFFLPKIYLFRYFWPIGTNPMTFILLGICFIPGWQNGLNILIVYLFISAIERSIKTTLVRKRPYQMNRQIEMSQPVTPNDASHPSGDAMRIWFLVILFPWAFSLSWQVFLISFCVAALVSLGRICLGVHYSLDVIGGSGLGIFGAGVAIILAETAGVLI